LAGKTETTLETAGSGATRNVALPDCVVSLTDVAVAVTVKRLETVVGGWYVAVLPPVLVMVPHDDAEQVGVPHVTPLESAAPPSVTVAVRDRC
jgi:hypothetical protein